MVDASDAEQLKNFGNDAVKAKNFTGAIECYTKAISLKPEEHTYYSNRATAYQSMEMYTEALADAEKCISIKDDFARGYQRKTQALVSLNRLDEAQTSCAKGLSLQADNKALLDLQTEIQTKLKA